MNYKMLFYIGFIFIIAGCSSGRFTPPDAHFVNAYEIIKQPPDVVWKKMFKALESQSFIISSHNKKSGIIITKGTEKNINGLDCGRVKGRAKISQIDYTLLIMIKPEADFSGVQINFAGTADAHRYRKFLFFPAGSRSYGVNCKSTGVVEATLFGIVR